MESFQEESYVLTYLLMRYLVEVLILHKSCLYQKVKFEDENLDTYQDFDIKIHSYG